MPRKSNEKMASDDRSKLDRDAYRNRNVIERCFGCLKEYCRIATHYDKTARNYLAMVKLGCIRLFYKRLCNEGTQPNFRFSLKAALGRCRGQLCAKSGQSSSDMTLQCPKKVSKSLEK